MLLVFPATVSAFSQALFVPIEYRQAYEKGTRTMDGTVSDSYWQNRTRYKLKAKIDPEAKLLTGNAEISYWNENCHLLF